MAKAMVINEWHVDYKQNAQGDYISIQGRTPGLISWVLSALGIVRGTRMVVNARHIQFSQSGWFGSSTRVIQLNQISSCYHGYKKPWIEAIILTFVLSGPCTILTMLMSFFLLSGSGSSGMAGLRMLGTLFSGYIIAAIIGVIYYKVKKTMTIGLVEVSGVVNEVAFRGSVLDGIKLDEQSSAQASAILQWLMDAAQSGSSA